MEAVKCRRPGDTRGMCLGSSRIRGAAAGYMGLQLDTWGCSSGDAEGLGVYRVLSWESGAALGKW